MKQGKSTSMAKVIPHTQDYETFSHTQDITPVSKRSKILSKNKVSVPKQDNTIDSTGYLETTADLLLRPKFLIPVSSLGAVSDSIYDSNYAVKSKGLKHFEHLIQSAEIVSSATRQPSAHGISPLQAAKNQGSYRPSQIVKKLKERKLKKSERPYYTKS